jgi:hypothetical protein
MTVRHIFEISEGDHPRTVTHARDHWWTLDFANAFVSPCVNSREKGGKILVADQIYRGRFLFASKNCENNKNTDFATMFLVLQQRENKRKLADVNVNKR